MHGLRRRVLLVGAIAPVAAWGQPPGRPARIGVLFIVRREIAALFLAALEDGLRTRGWRVGTDLLIEARYTNGDDSRIEALVTELLRAKVDVIVVTVDPVAQTVRKLTKTVPIVMTGASDPVRFGLIASLARLGGNVTGLTYDPGPELNAKPLQFLRELRPGLSRVAVLRLPHVGWRHLESNASESASALGIELHFVDLPSSGDLDPPFAEVRQGRAQAFMFWAAGSSLAWTAVVARRALAERLPSASQQLWYARDGGLLAYGSDVPDHFRRAATHVDKVLKGANPGELPMEQPTRMELVLNLRTAQALGLNVPASVRVRADRLID
jgi:putative ABC transport system substrate-binding protein